MEKPWTTSFYSVGKLPTVLPQAIKELRNSAGGFAVVFGGVSGDTACAPTRGRTPSDQARHRASRAHAASGRKFSPELFLFLPELLSKSERSELVGGWLLYVNIHTEI